MAIKVSGTTVIDDSRNIQNVGIITATTINATTITGDGSGLTGAGSTVADDTSTNATFYPLFTQTTSGIVTDSKVSTTKLTFNPSSGTVSATTFSGALSGNSSTATTLESARTIGGVSFDGSANIDLPGVNTTGNQDTSGNAATATKLATARTIELSGDVSGSVSFDGSSNVSIAATVADDSHNHIISNVDGLQDALDLKAPLASPALTGTPTAPTATAGTNTTQVATTAFVSTAVANLVDTAPAALDTLNELAAALDDDPNFATTISGQIGDKLDSSSYTASDVLTKIKTVDGTSSGLDADLLDGQEGSYYRNASNINAGTIGDAYLPATISSDVTGNAATATTLESARTIGGVSFDGSANINLPGVNTSGNQDTSGNAATATTLETSRTINGISFNGSSNIVVNPTSGAYSNGQGAKTVQSGGSASGGSSGDIYYIY